MPLEIIYKRPFGDDFKGISLNSRTGSGYTRLYMERSNTNRLYLFSGYHELIDMFYLENGKEIRIKRVTAKLITKLSKNVPVLHRLSREGQSFLERVYRMNGDYFFSFYEDDQDPWKNEPTKIPFQGIQAGLILTIGELFFVSA